MEGWTNLSTLMPNDFWKSKKKRTCRSQESRKMVDILNLKTGTKFMIYGLLGVFPE